MKCPVCLNLRAEPALTGTDSSFDTTNEIFNFSSCSRCRCLFMTPLRGSDDIAEFYPPEYWWRSRPNLLNRLEAIYRRFVLRDHVRFVISAAKRISNNSSPGSLSRSSVSHPLELLDIGCGSGTLLALLKKRGFQVLGVDGSQEAAHIATMENGVRVLAGSLEQLQFADSRFDVITLFHVLEHVTNPHELLAEVFRILRPNGALILQVPNVDSWQFRWFGSRWYGLDIPRHVVNYSKHAVLKLLADSRFSIHRLHHFNIRDNAPALVSSLFPWLDPVSRFVRQRRRNAHESTLGRWIKHLVYFFLVCCVYPIAALEAASGHGATLMIEARKQ
jgi:2-polyprenyl-3-methyl-5-hydroxy-6-metoxy-1,4-benzoquinol methylase